MAIRALGTSARWGRRAQRLGDKEGDEAERDVYIVGKTQDGQLAGLQTSVVET
jgi:Nuclease A inhibitor-like protein